MNNVLMGIITAIGLGALTVVHPCPLGTNIAAVSFLLSWREKSGNRIVLALFFVMGEIITFSVLGILISKGMLQIPRLANFLQNYMQQLLGPFLIIMGMMLSGILFAQQSTLKIGERFFARISRFGSGGSLIMGILIALSFCPMSAAMFFGVLIPLAVASNAGVLYPALFGLGASVPLLLIVVFILRSASFFSRLSFAKRKMGKKLSTFFGIVLILLGILMSLQHIFKVI